MPRKPHSTAEAIERLAGHFTLPTPGMHDRTQERLHDIPDVKHWCVRDIAAEGLRSASASIGAPFAFERRLTQASNAGNASELEEREKNFRCRTNYGYDPRD